MYSPQLLMWVERWGGEWRETGAGERKRERERESERERQDLDMDRGWGRTLRDTRSKRGKDQSDQLSDQGQSYEVHIRSSYLIQIQSFEWLHRGGYVQLTARIACLALCCSEGPDVLAKCQCSRWPVPKSVHHNKVTHVRCVRVN